jgi:hypothetical protein
MAAIMTHPWRCGPLARRPRPRRYLEAATETEVNSAE